MADHVSGTRQTIVALEDGAHTPSLALALRITKLFERSVEEVFWRHWHHLSPDETVTKWHAHRPIDIILST